MNYKPEPRVELNIHDMRVGNLYYYGNIPMSVHRLKVEDFCEFPEDLSSWKPIPLTIEWAERFGFKYFNSHSKKNTRTWYLDHFFIYFGKERGPKMNNNFLLPYVHNLQNVWWERKKCELTIKTDWDI